MKLSKIFGCALVAFSLITTGVSDIINYSIGSKNCSVSCNPSFSDDLCPYDLNMTDTKIIDSVQNIYDPICSYVLNTDGNFTECVDTRYIDTQANCSETEICVGVIVNNCSCFNCTGGILKNCACWTCSIVTIGDCFCSNCNGTISDCQCQTPIPTQKSEGHKLHPFLYLLFVL
jgi:hypothetical protein